MNVDCLNRTKSFKKRLQRGAGNSRLFAFLLFGSLLWVSPVFAEEKNSCVLCHMDAKFLVQNKKLYDYYKNWTRSGHYRNGVKCQDCHGGFPEKSEKEEAHGVTAVMDASNPKSAVNFRNIPGTCKKCHEEIFSAYKQSNHYAEFKDAGSGPNCVTCHGSLNAEILNANTVKATCIQCHNAKSGNSPEIPEKAELALNKYLANRRLFHWVVKHSTETGAKDVLLRVNAHERGLVLKWHTFDLNGFEKDVEKLIVDLKAERAKYVKNGDEASSQRDGP